jgi:CheY-like chemotaxis protein
LLKKLCPGRLLDIIRIWQGFKIGAARFVVLADEREGAPRQDLTLSSRHAAGASIRFFRFERTLKRIYPLPLGSSPSIFENIRILVVEDNADIRLLIARFLAQQGAQVFAAKNAFEGLRLVRKIRPNVVVSDINMPGRNGLEFLADIRTLGKNSGGSVPVIAITAYVIIDEVLADAGFQRVLRKPFTPDQLLATIDSVL